MATRILGIDPGSRCTGYGILEQDNGLSPTYVTHGYIATNSTDMSQKLLQIHQNLVDIIQLHQPNEIAIEQVFLSQNPQTALKLGQARGAALVATAGHDLPMAEYSARQIKKSVVGYGAAAKTQIQHMIKILLKLSKPVQADAADALAVALCHCHHRRGNL